MNQSTYSAECAHKMHEACDYEDCACECHFVDRINTDAIDDAIERDDESHNEDDELGNLPLDT